MGSGRTSGRAGAESSEERPDRSPTAEKPCSTAVAPAGSAILRSGWRYWPLDPASTPALVSRALQPDDRRCRRPSTNEGTDHENVVYNRGRLSPAGDGRANAAGRSIGAGDRQGRGGSRRQAAVRAEPPGAPPVAGKADQSPPVALVVRRARAASGGHGRRKPPRFRAPHGGGLMQTAQPLEPPERRYASTARTRRFVSGA